jgi:hypothetical protein
MTWIAWTDRRERGGRGPGYLFLGGNRLISAAKAAKPEVKGGCGHKKTQPKDMPGEASRGFTPFG